MIEYEGALRHPFSSKIGENGTQTTSIDGEDFPERPSSGKSFSPRQIFQKIHHFHIRGLFCKAKERLNKIQDKCRVENIPLALAKQDLQPGQEWIKGPMLCALATGAIGVLNVILTVVAAGIAYSKKAGDTHSTYAEVYQGDCSITSGWTTGMHLVINVLSTILLAASNYVMQCLSAPSRADVDKAHSQGDWLDIGIFSIRNLWLMDSKRKILWVLIFISSFPIHMVYNTALFSSISTVEYGVVVIPSDLRRNESLVKDEYEADSFYQLVGYTPEDILDQRFDGTFRNLSIPDCFKTYNQEFNTKGGTVLLVTDRENLGGSSSAASSEQLMMGYQKGWLGYQVDSIAQSDVESFKLESQHWNYPKWSFKNETSSDWGYMTDLCNRRQGPDYAACYDVSEDTQTLQNFIWNTNPSEMQVGDFLSTASNWRNSSWAAGISFRIDALSDPKKGYSLLVSCSCDDGNYGDVPSNITISGCMASDAKQHCQLYFSLPICIAVIACNIIKVLCMYMTARTGRKEIFLTIGDALSSFLDKPDVTTRGECVLSRKDTTLGLRQWTRRTLGMPFKGAPTSMSTTREACPPLLPKRRRWIQAASWRRWAFTYIVFLACLAISGYLYYLATRYLTAGFSEISKLGMGKASGTTILELSVGQDLIALALLANTPQLVFSTLYLLCNGVFTCMAAIAEYNNFALQRKPLRVSWPKGEQRSTHYLSLPYRYSVPLITVSVAMHWLLSQAIFLVKINAFGKRGESVDYSSYSSDESTQACGYSPLAMFITIIVGAAAIATLFGFSLKPLRSNMPLVSSSSFAISAACHPPPGDEDASMKPVMWGEVQQDSNDTAFSFQSTIEDRAGDYGHCTFTSKEVTTPGMVRVHG